MAVTTTVAQVTLTGVEDDIASVVFDDATSYVMSDFDGTLASVGVGLTASGLDVFVDDDAGGGTSYTLTASNGVSLVTGTPVVLTLSATLTADAGEYTLTGSAVVFQSPGGHYFLNAEAGGYDVEGAASGLNLDTSTPAEPGAFSLTGTDTRLNISKTLTADAGSYTLTGSAVVFTYSADVSQIPNPVTVAYGSDGITVTYSDNNLTVKYNGA